MIDKPISTGISGVFWCFFTSLLFLFQIQFFSAQDSSEQQIQSPTSISVIGDAMIYSADDSFNEKITSPKLNFKGVVKKIKGSDDTVSLVVSSVKTKTDQENNFASQVKELQRKKEGVILKKVKHQLAKYEKQKANHEVDTCNFPDSSSVFFHAKHSAQNAAVSSSNTPKFSKFYVAEYKYIVKRAVENSYSQKYRSYNNKSIDYCYSLVFSVRPPPVLA